MNICWSFNVPHFTMLSFYLDFCCAVNYSIRVVHYCNATTGLYYQLKTITNFEFPKTENSMCVTKDITATKTKVNITFKWVAFVILCSMSRFQQHLYHIGLFQEWIYTNPQAHQSVDRKVQAPDFFNFTFSYYCNGQQFSCFANQIWFLPKEQTDIFH